MTDLTVLEFPKPSGGGPPPNADVIATLRVLLESAEIGSLQSIAYVATQTDADAPPATGFAGQQRNALAMGATMLVDLLMWRATDV